MFIFTKTFWGYAGERAIKTVAQTMVASLTVAGITGVLDVFWIAVLSTAALAGLVSLLTSLSSYDAAKNITISDKASPIMGATLEPSVMGESFHDLKKEDNLY